MKLPKLIAGAYHPNVPGHRTRRDRRRDTPRGSRRWFHNQILAGVKGGKKSYSIASSLLFRGAQYVSRTPTVAGNRQKWTVSAWVRRGGPGQKIIFAASAASSDTTNLTEIFFSSGDALGIYANGGALNMASTALFRDYSSFYHVVVAVDTTQATAADRVKAWVNGVQITSWATNTVCAQNTNLHVNNTIPHYFGKWDGGSHFDGPMAEPIIVDGEQLTASSVGEFDPVTLNWRPKRVSVSAWGTNGCYLGKGGWTFATLGTDQSGQGNNWTANGFVSTDVLSDSPTNVYAIMNPLLPSTSTYSNGNLTVTGGQMARASMPIPDGDWYWEVTPPAVSSGGQGTGLASDAASTSTYLGQDANSWSYEGSSGNKRTNAAPTAYGSTYTNTDTVAVAAKRVAGSLSVWFGKVSGGVVTWANSGNPATGANPAFTGITGDVFPACSSQGVAIAWTFNFGQRAFAGAAPTGFKSLCTSNLPAPSAAAKQPWKYYGAQLVVHNGTSSTFTLGWNPDPANGGSHTLFRIKCTTTAGTSWWWIDTVRGLNKYLNSEGTGAEGTNANILTSAPSTGVCVIGAGLGAATYLIEAWRVSPESGFDIALFNGVTGSPVTVNHNNGTSAALIHYKARSVVETWLGGMPGVLGTGYFCLNTTAAYTPAATFTSNSAASFTLGSGYTTGSATYVAYVWSEVPGFSKFDKWVNNNSADGVCPYFGFKASTILSKASDAADAWYLHNAAHNDNKNPASKYLNPNSSNAEGTSTHDVDFLSVGAKMRTANSPNFSTWTTIYSAFSLRCIGGQGVSPALAA